ncbi:unnamed protein product [Pleuronectes platessa]|uniref:Uncharacterized protein n=1 Tax=Pleuronectes platessa TaxID=8262 RepID=A0A9N7TIX8_PLEPL|nr:unnamed protein product [Pleuronectes platessa]
MTRSEGGEGETLARGRSKALFSPPHTYLHYTCLSFSKEPRAGQDERGVVDRGDTIGGGGGDRAAGIGGGGGAGESREEGDGGGRFSSIWPFSEGGLTCKCFCNHRWPDAVVTGLSCAKPLVNADHGRIQVRCIGGGAVSTVPVKGFTPQHLQGFKPNRQQAGAEQVEENRIQTRADPESAGRGV